MPSATRLLCWLLVVYSFMGFSSAEHLWPLWVRSDPPMARATPALSPVGMTVLKLVFFNWLMASQRFHEISCKAKQALISLSTAKTQLSWLLFSSSSGYLDKCRNVHAISILAFPSRTIFVICLRLPFPYKTEIFNSCNSSPTSLARFSSSQKWVTKLLPRAANPSTSLRMICTQASLPSVQILSRQSLDFLDSY